MLSKFFIKTFKFYIAISKSWSLFETSMAAINIRNKLATVLVILWCRRRRRQKTKAKTNRKFWISPSNANVPYFGHITVHFCWWWWWWSIVFVVWLTDERRLALFPAATIVRDPHHCKYPTRREQDLNLRRTWVQSLLKEVVQ